MSSVYFSFPAKFYVEKSLQLIHYKYGIAITAQVLTDLIISIVFFFQMISSTAIIQWRLCQHRSLSQ